MCASACFLLFAAGARRIAGPSALIGVHSVSNGAGSEDLNTMGFTTALARDASDYNVPAQIIGELVTMKPGQITWLNVSELTSMGVTLSSARSARHAIATACDLDGADFRARNDSRAGSASPSDVRAPNRVDSDGFGLGHYVTRLHVRYGRP